MEVKRRITKEREREREVSPGKIKLPGDSIEEICPFISIHLEHYDKHADFKTDIKSLLHCQLTCGETYLLALP